MGCLTSVLGRGAQHGHVALAVVFILWGTLGLAQETSHAHQRVLWESQFTAEQPTVDTGGSQAMPLIPTTPVSESLTEESTNIVRGMVEAFLHRQQLEPGEADCLAKGSGKLAGDVMGVSANLVMLFEQATGKKPSQNTAGYSTGASQGTVNDGAGAIEDTVNDIMGGHGGEATSEDEEQQRREVEQRNKEAETSLDLFYGSGRRLEGISPSIMAMAPGLFMQMGMIVKKMVGLAHDIVKECLHHDALVALDEAAEHMQSVQYVSGHLMANGQDVVSELADSVNAYKNEDYRKFGEDLGTALRKVFLSKRGDSGLPEGLPGKYVVSNVTTGLLKGLFGEGSEVDIKVPGDIDHPPSVIHVDLHHCIGDNLRFFQSAWAEVMFFYAKRAVGAVDEKDKVQWSTAVAFTMMQLPNAMEKCNLGPEEQQVLEDAIKGLASGGGGINLDFKMPSDARVSGNRMEKHLAITVKDWAKMRWLTFGKDLGKLLQEMAATVYDKKYSIDEHGILRRIATASTPAGGTSGGALLAAVAMAAMVTVTLASRRVVGRSGAQALLDIEAHCQGAE